MKKKLTMFILIAAGVAGMFVVYTNLTIERVGVEVGNAAVDFTLPTWTEEERSLSSYSGDIVIMNMWLLGVSHVPGKYRICFSCMKITMLKE